MRTMHGNAAWKLIIRFGPLVMSPRSTKKLFLHIQCKEKEGKIKSTEYLRFQPHLV